MSRQPQYFYVRALVSGPWKAVDVFDRNGQKYGERTLVMAVTKGTWNSDNEPAEVEPGLLVSFRDYPDAAFFLDQNRATWLLVEPGMCVAFHRQSDAEFFISRKLGEMITKDEAEEVWAEAHALHMAELAAENGEGEMFALSPPKQEAETDEGEDGSAEDGKASGKQKRKASGKKGRARANA